MDADGTFRRTTTTANRREIRRHASTPDVAYANNRSNRIYRTQGNSDTTTKLKSEAELKNGSSNHDAFNDCQSAQSSITNSWAPKMRAFHPPPYHPHKPIENMVITVSKTKRGDPNGEDSEDEHAKNKEEHCCKGDDTTNSTAISSTVAQHRFGIRTDVLHDVQEVELDDSKMDEIDTGDTGNDDDDDELLKDSDFTQEQRAEAEEFVFRAWGSSDDGDPNSCHTGGEAQQRPRNVGGKKKSSSWFFAPRKLLAASSSNDEYDEPSSLPTPVCIDPPNHNQPQDLDDAIRELQELGGIEVKCLDEQSNDEGEVADDEADPSAQPAWGSFRRSKKDGNITAPPSDGEQAADVAGKETPESSNWFFANKQNSARKQLLLDDKDELAQPYAIARTEEDKERLRQHREEEERLRQEDERKRMEDKSKKGKSWFFTSKEGNQANRQEEQVFGEEDMMNALDDLEVIAGDGRVTQVKEARLKGGDEDEPAHQPSTPTSPGRNGRHSAFLSQERKSDRMLRDKVSPEVAGNRKQLPEKLNRSLSRFELPIDTHHDSASRLGSSSGRMVQKVPEESRDIDDNGKPANLEGIESVNVTRSSDGDDEAVLDDYESDIDESMPPPPKASDLKKESLINDESKRNSRWQLNQILVNDLFKPFRTAIADKDDFLPSTDQFSSFDAALGSVDGDFSEIRDRMLEGGSLSEREIAAFFEGLAVYTVKLNSMKSQIEAMQGVSRAQEAERRYCKGSNVPGSGDGSTGVPPRCQLIKSLLQDEQTTSEAKALLKQLDFSEKKRSRLENELMEHGITFPDDTIYEEALSKVECIERRIQEVSASDPGRYNKRKQAEKEEELERLEVDFVRHSASLQLGEAWRVAEEHWEKEIVADNMDALSRIRRHMPINVRSLNENQMTIPKTPNGKLFPRRIAKRIEETNILQLLRTSPNEIFDLHPATLENLNKTGLTLSERRALHAHLNDVGRKWRCTADDPKIHRKWSWFRTLKQELKEAISAYQEHVVEFGPPNKHPYASRLNALKGCPLIGNKCPVKAEKSFDYATDYGFPDGPEYDLLESNVVDTSGSKDQEAVDRLKLKKAQRRNEPFQKHYDGLVLEVALANGSCEAMDEVMDRMEDLQTRWIEDRIRLEDSYINDERRRLEMGQYADAVHELKVSLPPFIERSGMQLTGKKEINAKHPDLRSIVELGLCEEVWEHAEDFFFGIEFRLKELGAKETGIKDEIGGLRELMNELHDRNMKTINSRGARYPVPSRKLIKRKELEIAARTKVDLEAIEKVADEPEPAPTPVPAPAASTDRLAKRRSSCDSVTSRSAASRSVAGDARSRASMASNRFPRRSTASVSTTSSIFKSDSDDGGLLSSGGDSTFESIASIPAHPGLDLAAENYSVSAVSKTMEDSSITPSFASTRRSTWSVRSKESSDHRRQHSATNDKLNASLSTLEAIRARRKARLPPRNPESSLHDRSAAVDEEDTSSPTVSKSSEPSRPQVRSLRKTNITAKLDDSQSNKNDDSERNGRSAVADPLQSSSSRLRAYSSTTSPDVPVKPSTQVTDKFDRDESEVSEPLRSRSDFRSSRFQIRERNGVAGSTAATTERVESSETDDVEPPKPRYTSRFSSTGKSAVPELVRKPSHEEEDEPPKPHSDFRSSSRYLERNGGGSSDDGIAPIRPRTDYSSTRAASAAKVEAKAEDNIAADEDKESGAVNTASTERLSALASRAESLGAKSPRAPREPPAPLLTRETTRAKSPSPLLQNRETLSAKSPLFQSREATRAKSPLLQSLEASRAKSPLLRTGESVRAKSPLLASREGLRAKSPAAIRERIHAKSPSPGQEDRTNESAAETADRLAALEARREKMRATVAARKKAREEAAAKSEQR